MLLAFVVRRIFNLRGELELQLVGRFCLRVSFACLFPSRCVVVDSGGYGNDMRGRGIHAHVSLVVGGNGSEVAAAVLRATYATLSLSEI